MLNRSRSVITESLKDTYSSGKPRSHTVDLLLEWADKLGYSLVLVPVDGGENIVIDEVSVRRGC